MKVSDLIDKESTTASLGFDLSNEKQQKNRATFSVVTATYNAINHLPRLIESLRGQTDKDFEWVVADGMSDDGTLEMLRSIDDLKIVISSLPDFGIYDALNRAIKISKSEYYIVVGADDFLDGESISNFRCAADQSNADLIIASAKYNNQYISVRKGPSWLFGHSAFIASHSLATAFRKDLHCLYGFYSRRFPIAADQLFVMRACKGGASRHESNFIAGEKGHEGVSGVDLVGNATEVFRVQLTLGHSRFIQILLLLLRLLK